MKRKIFGVVLSALFVFSMVSVSFAADQDFKRYGVRVRGLYVMPNDHFSKALDTALGTNLELQEAVSPELDLEYFFTKHISAELDLTLTKLDVTTQNGGINNGSLWILPPSLYLKYHFAPGCPISPYVGVGMNVIMPFDERLTLNGTSQVGNFKVDTSVGWAAKVGMDVPVSKNTYLNLDAMYYYARTQVTAGPQNFYLELNPVIVSTGIGFRF